MDISSMLYYIFDGLKSAALLFTSELSSLANVQVLMKLIGVVIFGYILAKIVKLVIVKILIVTGIRRLTQKSWFNDFLKASGYKKDLVEFLGDIVKWSIYLLTFTIILQLLGITSVSFISTEIINFIPRFIFAVLILIVGFMIADFFGKAFEEAALKLFGDEGVGKLSGGITKYSVALTSLIISLALLGFDIAALLVLLSILLLVVVIILYTGIKDIIPEFSAGFTVKRMFRVGNKVKVDGYEGIIESFEPLFVVLISGKKTIRLPNTMLIKNPTIKEEKKIK